MIKKVLIFISLSLTGLSVVGSSSMEGSVKERLLKKIAQEQADLRSLSSEETDAIETLELLRTSPVTSSQFEDHPQFSPIDMPLAMSGSDHVSYESSLKVYHTLNGIGNAGKTKSGGKKRGGRSRKQVKEHIVNHAYVDDGCGNSRLLTEEEQKNLYEALNSQSVRVGEPKKNMYQCLLCSETRRNKQNMNSHLCTEHYNVSGWKHSPEGILYKSISSFWLHEKR